MNRTRVFAFSLVFYSALSWANEKTPAMAATSDAKLYYFENVPNNDQKFSFSYNQFCDAQQAPVRIEEFHSDKKYPTARVRVVHLYVRHNGKCKLVSGDKFEQIFKLPRSKLMTHVFVTADSDIEVRSTQ